MTRTSSRLPAWLTWLSLIGAASAGCGGGEVAGLKSSDELDVQVSQFFVTVVNRGGRNLVDLRVEIHPVGGATVYTTTYPRLDPGQKADFSLGGFRGRDGTPFNLRVVKPKLVLVSAGDSAGGTHEVGVPWP